MNRSILALGLLFLAALSGCADNVSAPDEPAPEPWNGHLWRLISLNGQAVSNGPPRGDIFATQTDAVLWFEAGCGFSVSVHQTVPIVRGPQSRSRPCSAIDLERLAAVEAMVRDGGSVSVDEEKILISNEDGRNAVFEAQQTGSPRE